MTVRTPTRAERGRFQAFVNEHARRASPEDKALVHAIYGVVTEWSPAHQVEWAGSTSNGTAIEGSDLDLWVVPRTGDAPTVSKPGRRKLADLLKRRLQRQVQVRSHAVHIPGNRRTPGADLSFVDATFGGRPVPARDANFHDQPALQGAARAAKLWIQEARLPRAPGWVIETIVLAVGNERPAPRPLDQFLGCLEWLLSRSTAELERLLQPEAHPGWDPDWSRRLPGQLEAIQNDARRLLGAWEKGTSWSDGRDVRAWLTR